MRRSHFTVDVSAETSKICLLRGKNNETYPRSDLGFGFCWAELRSAKKQVFVGRLPIADSVALQSKISRAALGQVFGQPCKRSLSGSFAHP